MVEGAFLDGIEWVPDEDCPEGMIGTRDENGNLVPLGFIVLERIEESDG